MFKNTTRAKRRYHRARLINNRKCHWGYGLHGWRNDSTSEFTTMPKELKGLVANTPTPCSCDMCGNPRRTGWLKKYDKLKMQEKKALDNYNNQLEELKYGS